MLMPICQIGLRRPVKTFQSVAIAPKHVQSVHVVSASLVNPASRINADRVGLVTVRAVPRPSTRRPDYQMDKVEFVVMGDEAFCYIRAKAWFVSQKLLVSEMVELCRVASMPPLEEVGGPR
jgi:hypothetical protein